MNLAEIDRDINEIRQIEAALLRIRGRTFGLCVDCGSSIEYQRLEAQLTGYRELRRQGALPVPMDEGVVSPADLIEFIRLEACDGVAMKPSRCGGLISAKAQIELLRDRGLGWLGSGLADPDISLAATLCNDRGWTVSQPALGESFSLD